jgi:serine/threonine-protein kinase
MSLVICSKGHQVTLGARFCQQCGEPLPRVKSHTTQVASSENGLGELPSGTWLRDRYLIQQQLGQGGFGRTYLAEDTGRFHEKVAIKEFVPNIQGTQALQKAEELFEREAITLHQLQHPQIPRFWETFREGKRLFLVEDFIEGQNYQSLLDQRLSQGKCFNEAEILHLFRELLPVLSYLHRQGVIHRDISPDNIILRAKDKQPVLIDLGGVKQVAIDVATQVAGVRNRAVSGATCLGKVGYAPDEQLRLGIVAPHSDLYALAVTALVLMTGKQPQDLLDQNTLHWTWHRELTLSPLLTKILNQMLHRQPSQRFKSADEISQLLQSNSSSRTHAATKPTQLLQSNLSNRTYAATEPTEFKAPAPVNNSGQGGIFDSSIQVPDEIKGWNWGAFLLAPFWLFPNRVWIGLLIWIPSINWWMVCLNLAMPFILGAKGNEWSWKSRKWSSGSAFKAHQRAWTIWGLIINGSCLTLFLLVTFFVASVPELRKAFIEGVKAELTRGELAPNSSPQKKQIKPARPSQSLPTPTKDQVLKVEIGQLETFTYPGSLFSLDVPTGWSYQDNSKSGEAIAVWMDQNLNAGIVVDLFAIRRKLTQDQLVKLLRIYLIHSFRSQQDFKIEPSQLQEDNSIRLTWSYTAIADNGIPVKVRGNSFIGAVRDSDKISIFSYLVPLEQWSELQIPMNRILDSYRINPSAPLP